MYTYMYLYTHMHRVRDNLIKQDQHVAEWRSKHQSPQIPEASAQEGKVSQQHPHCLQARNAVVSRIQGCTMWQSPTESARADNCQKHRLPKKVIWGPKKKSQVCLQMLVKQTQTESGYKRDQVCSHATRTRKSQDKHNKML